MPARTAPQSVVPEMHEHRRRLLEGMARAIAAKSYGDITIADIVAEAAVSRRTFYEHFDGKPACLIALYEAASLASLRVLRDAVDRGRPWHDQVQGAMEAYLGSIAESPALMRTLLVEILHLGLPGLSARRRVHLEIAALIRSIVNRGRHVEPLLSTEMALAIVGGVHELVLERIESGRASQVKAVSGIAAELVVRVAGGAGGRSADDSRPPHPEHRT